MAETNAKLDEILKAIKNNEALITIANTEIMKLTGKIDLMAIDVKTRKSGSDKDGAKSDETSISTNVKVVFGKEFKLFMKDPAACTDTFRQLMQLPYFAEKVKGGCPEKEISSLGNTIYMIVRKGSIKEKEKGSLSPDENLHFDQIKNAYNLLQETKIIYEGRLATINSSK